LRNTHLTSNIQSIILFGSKSTGTDDIWSDYDFYIVTKREFGWNEKFEIYKKLDFSVDVIFRTLSQVKEGIDSFCSIDIYALKFGRVVYGEELYEEKERISELIDKKKMVLRPELGKGVIEYGYKTEDAMKGIGIAKKTLELSRRFLESYFEVKIPKKAEELKEMIKSELRQK